MARLVAASVVVHSFSSDQLGLRVGGLLSNRNVSSGRARLEQLVCRNEFPSLTSLNQRENHRWPLLRRGRRHHGGTTTEPCLDVVPPTVRDSLRRMTPAHTDPSLVIVVALC